MTGRPFKIGIDCRTVLARKTGDRTYILNLVHGLAELSLDPGQWQFQLLMDAPDEERLLPAGANFHTHVITAPNSRLWTMAALPLYARRAGLNLIHVQYLAPPVAPCPVVATIHDVVWCAMPRTFPQMHRAVMRYLMPLTARRAALILCGTQSARADIGRYLHAAPRKIRVTPYSVEPRFYQPVAPQAIVALRTKYGLGDAPYLLSVGVLQPRKNLPSLIKAFEQLQKRRPDWPHQLVIAGKKGWGENAQQQNSKSKIRFIGYVDDEELPALYAGAELFAYPSLYEGFGLPLIEAMASGCAVLTSDYGAMAEVAGDAAQLVDPRSVGSISQSMERVLCDETQLQTLRQRGRHRAAQFSSKSQAMATLEAYRLTFAKLI